MRLPDELFSEVRRRAADEGRTVTSFVEAALRVALAAPQPARTFRLVPFEGTGTLPGVDLADAAGLLALMEG